MNKKIRCAIYTRKSSEEGLEQDFNSLDAQREACEAYIKSQIHEGWILIEKQYNDGGFSGGNMERPAFKELLSDIEKDEVDIVVVYKVDRLTRSLMDFAKIVDVFDKHNTSFVSITQHFNTTTSMGRLTLNILLSFAQFEREVTGERIRDKFAASRRKGMFIHGTAPIGYIKKDGTLISDNKQVPIINLIFKKYLELKSVSKLQAYLKENEIKTKTGKFFAKGNLHNLLRNKIFIGKIVHKDEEYEGLHEGIIDEKLFFQVQKLLDENTVKTNNSVGAKHFSLLAGKLYDDKNNIMTPSHSRNKYGACYRYYISQAILKYNPNEAGTISKIPAKEIEEFITLKISEFIKNKNVMLEYLSELDIKKQKCVIEFLQNYEPDRIFIRTIINRIDINVNNIRMYIDKDLFIKSVQAVTYGELMNFKSKADHLISFNYDVKLSPTARCGTQIVIGHNKVEYNLVLIQAITKGFYYNKLLEGGRMPKELKDNSYVRRLMKLRFLPPDIIESVLNGTQPRTMTLKDLLKSA